MSKPQAPSIAEQVGRFKLLLEGRRLTTHSPVFQTVISFIRSGVRLSDQEKKELSYLIQSTFSLSETEMMTSLLGVKTNDNQSPPHTSFNNHDQALSTLIPRPSWFADYVDYSSNSEVPLAFHVFCSLLLSGATMGRRVWFDMGYFRVYPPLSIFLLGPSGTKKTTASDIAINIVNELLITSVYAEKITPEALALSMSENSQGIIYAPEATVLMGKQKYNEGLIPFITRLLDCPNSLTPTTITRGATPIKDIAVSVLACSTVDWFIENTPEDTFGGGFIARLLLVHQQGTDKVHPIPKVKNVNESERLGKEILKLRELKGEMKFSEEAFHSYVDWYTLNKSQADHPKHEILASYYRRKPIHVIRLAMNFHLVVHRNLEICTECFTRSVSLLEWNEQFLPPMLEELFKTREGRDHKFILDQISSSGGVVTHEMLVRKVQFKMSATQLRSILSSLKEAKQVEEISNSLIHSWRLL